MTNESLFEELMHKAFAEGIIEELRENYSTELKKQFPEYGPKDYGDRYAILRVEYKKIISNMTEYKIQIIPLNTTSNKQELPYVIEVVTKDIENYMDQFQRNRDAFEWKVL